MPAEEQGKVAAVHDAYRKSIPKEWLNPHDPMIQAFQFLTPASTTPPLE